MASQIANKIQILPEFIANQIAAGEVVEGPSSIVKELVENSIDAQADQIEINISKNFLKLEFIDNGIGIAQEDLSVAFKKHATSKITSIEDLNNLASNGFRGEALASISAVSKLTCISKSQSADQAYKIYLENGSEEITPSSAGFGTKIIVDDLFFNTPARLKFLKSNSKERANIIDITRGLALANPQVKISLSIDNKNTFKTSGSNKLNVCLSEIFKQDSSNLLEVRNEQEDISITGFCSKPSNTRSDKRALFTIVNDRILDCYIIKSAIESIYKELLAPGKHPIAVIKLDLPASLIDVNVHPNKKQIKYENTNEIYRLVQNAIDSALRKNAYTEHEQMQTQIKDQAIPEITKGEITQERVIQKALVPEAPKSIPQFEAKPNLSPQTLSNTNFDMEEKLFNSKKFLARFNSIDIKLIDNTDVQNIVSTQGNKTRFDYAHKNFKENRSVLFQGEFIGEKWLEEKLFKFFSEIGDEIFLREQNKTLKTNNQSRPQATVPKSILEKIWQRDNYTCVYCAKALLDPKTVKEKLSECSNPDELNSHTASHDHHIPASQAGALNKDEDNLYAVCQECNIKKSNSQASNTWQPQRSNTWKEEQVIAGINFKKPS